MLGSWRLPWAVVLSCALVTYGSENWSRFRGPNGQGISEAETIPVKWSADDYLWKVELPGEGHSSPVVWEDRVFVTCADEKGVRGHVLCLDASDGGRHWQKTYDFSKYPLNSLNSFASATPAVDAEGVCVLWPGAEVTTVAALGHDGTEQWTVKLPGVQTQHGAGSSPILHDDLVIVSHEQDEKRSETPSRWVALDRRTGRTRWRHEHPKNARASYSTPCIYRDGRGREQVIFTSNLYGVAALDPGTGELLWQSAEPLPARVVASPVIAGDLIVGTCGRGGRGVRLTAVNPPRTGGARETYGLDRGVVPYVPTPIVHDGLLFLFHDQGTVSCLRSGTGEVLWSEKPAGRYYGSPVCVGGRLYCITVEGEVVVLEAGPEYRLLGVNPLGEKSHATPAVGGGRMYLRTLSHLIAIGNPQKGG